MEVHWVGLTDIAESERARAEERVIRLADRGNDLIDLRITGRASRHHQHGDKEVRITCQARGQAIVAARTCPDLGLALHEALDVFEREVTRLREKRQDRARA